MSAENPNNDNISSWASFCAQLNFEMSNAVKELWWGSYFPPIKKNTTASMIL